MDPRGSGGYTYWEGNSNAENYQIKTYTKNATNAFQLLNTITTSKNYHRFDPMFFHVPNAHFEIVALSLSGTILAYTDKIECRSFGDLGNVDICKVVCNGVSYAYEINISEHHWINNQIDPPIMDVRSTLKFYDPITAISMPYWQAMTQQQYNALPSAHPYTQGGQNAFGTGFAFFYKRENINSTLVPGPFLDKYNVPITSGLIIEKKMDQFEHFSTAYTPPNVTILEADCSNSLSGPGNSWINIINNYATGITYPTFANAFTNTIVHDLACQMSIAGANPNPVGSNWNQWILDLYAQVAAIEGSTGNVGNGTQSWDEVHAQIMDFSELVSEDGDYVTGAVFSSLSNDGKGNIIFARANQTDRLLLHEATGEFNPGIYKLTIYTSESDVFPFYLKVSSEIEKPTDKAFLEFVIAPNPVSDNVLKYEIRSEKDMVCQVLVHDMFGNLITSQLINLLNGNSELVEYELQNVNSPYSQLLASVICPDGSVVQKTVAVL